MTERKSRKKRPTKFENMSREQLQHTLLKKRECTARAQQMVVRLLDTGISEELFLESLAHINQNHFDDIAEERSILKQCGYPICNDKLAENIPKQQYKISLRTNKVYDITSRKNYCSNRCYKAAMFIKQQILTSPLWFREDEVIPDFKLLPVDSKGIVGEELDVAIVEKVRIKNMDHTKHINSFTSIATFAEASLDEIPNELEMSVNDITLNNVSSIEKNQRTSLSEIPDVIEKNMEDDNMEDKSDIAIDELADTIESKMMIS